MFVGYILNKEENDEFKYERYKSKFNELISKCSEEQQDKCIIEFINAIGEVNGQKQKLLFSILENSVNQNKLSTMIVCSNLLNADKLQFANEQFWCASFNLIRKIIDKADYKEIRDLLKIMLDLITNIPTSFNIAMLPQLNSIYQIFEYVFNRDLSLFPAYLVFDEIRKKTHSNKIGTPHWRFSKLIYSFVDSFRPVANMCSLAGRTKLYPIVCNRSNSEKKVWQLDMQGRFVFKCLLPFNKELLEPQHHFLKYALMQPYSREFVHTLLQIKNRSVMIEDIFIEILVSLMERSEEESESNRPQLINQWQIITNNVRDFVISILFQEIIKRLIPILSEKNLRKGRDQLVWLILQFLPMTLVKGQFNYLIPFIKLIDILYIEKEPLPLPNLNSSQCVQSFAASSIWIISMMKAETDQIKLTRSPPIALKTHIEFIKQNALNINSNLNCNLSSDFNLAIIGNCYFANNTNNLNTSNESLAKILNCLIEYITGNKQQQQQQQQGKPLPVAFLDSLSVQMKIHLAQHLITLINKHIKSSATQQISPIILETFFRLAANSEIENPFLKQYFVNNLCPPMTPLMISKSSIIAHNLLESWTYRTNHIKLNLHIQLITFLNSITNMTNTSTFPYQLKLCVENTLQNLVLKLSALDVIMVLNISQKQTFDALISKESEEYNKILILVIARAIHTTHYSETLSSEWCNDILPKIMHNTPLSWSLCTIKCFPKHMNEFYLKQQQQPQSNRRQVSEFVNEHYRKFVSLTNSENELIQHFCQSSTPTVFICVIWKSIYETSHLNPIAFKVLDKFTSEQFTANIRSFCDYLIFEIAKLSGEQLKKYIDTLNDLIWKYYILSLDKLFLCLVLRPFEDEEIEFNICLLIIQDILEKSEFRNRLNEFVNQFTPEHWLDDNLQDKQTAYLNKYPEKFYFDFLTDKQQQQQQQPATNQSHPYYFSNVCLRFLPVLDLIVHRYLEQFKDNQVNQINQVNNADKWMKAILDQMSPLYKFHNQPITFLYNTLHYYESKLRNKPAIKKKLVASVLNSFRDLRQRDWALTDDYLNYMNAYSSNHLEWSPNLDYYMRLVGRLVDSIKGEQQHSYPNFDWKFYEFKNVGCHALHVICVELMALPKAGNVVANSLIDLIMIGHKTMPRSEIMNWINAIGLILTGLPEDYHSILNNRIIQMLESPLLIKPDRNEDIFKIMDFTSSHNSLSELKITYLIALAHSFYQHSYIGQVSQFPVFLNEKVKPIIRTEEQFIFICHIIAPFLDRLVSERTRIACDLTILLYEMLEIIDKNIKEFQYMESICDLLYYIKYSFTGDSVKDEIEPFIMKLREPLKLRLRFVVHLPFKKAATTADLPTSIQNNINQMNQMPTIKQEINSFNNTFSNVSNQQQLSLKHQLDDKTNLDSTKRLKIN